MPIKISKYIMYTLIRYINKKHIRQHNMYNPRVFILLCEIKRAETYVYICTSIYGLYQLCVGFQL